MSLSRYKAMAWYSFYDVSSTLCFYLLPHFPVWVTVNAKWAILQSKSTAKYLVQQKLSLCDLVYRMCVFDRIERTQSLRFWGILLVLAIPLLFYIHGSPLHGQIDEILGAEPFLQVHPFCLSQVWTKLSCRARVCAAGFCWRKCTRKWRQRNRFSYCSVVHTCICGCLSFCDCECECFVFSLNAYVHGRCMCAYVCAWLCLCLFLCLRLCRFAWRRVCCVRAYGVCVYIHARVCACAYGVYMYVCAYSVNVLLLIVKGLVLRCLSPRCHSRAPWNSCARTVWWSVWDM